MTSIIQSLTTSTGQIDYIQLFKFIATIIGIFGGLAGLAVTFFTKSLPWLRTKIDQHSLAKRFGAELYPKGVIENSTRYYIQPDCQSLDPSGSEEPRLVLGTKENLFDKVDEYLTHPTDFRYLILLADSGMGKTSFFLNYYARHLRKRQKFKLALLPLGIPDVDKRIEEMNDKKDTVLFLDAFDEDTLAIVDHVARLRIILDLTREFQKVLLTCRTQFFPKDEEIPQQTGIVKIGPRPAGEGGEYVFHKLYLSPLSDKQVDKYLKRCYSFWQRKRRKKAEEMVEKIPNLIVRPMLLAYINDLVRSEREITHVCQLYEEMVEGWLIREEGIVKRTQNKKEYLRQFSEQLAVDLYVKREHRRSERIPGDEIQPLAKQWNIPLEDWELKGRSLLNRDADGNYKFAHRSIMEYLFVKRLVEGDEKCSWYDLTDQMRVFAVGMAKYNVHVKLRSEPINGSSINEIKRMIKKYNFFDSQKHVSGKGITHCYHLFNVNQDKVVIDFATGLTWQQGGLENSINYRNALSFIDNLNKNNFVGFSDWRLPTLEEAMSLMECTKKNSGLNIDPIFSSEQNSIWTSDKINSSAPWVVSFDFSVCTDVHVVSVRYVRAVR